jgi:hypothetical protein
MKHLLLVITFSLLFSLVPQIAWAQMDHMDMGSMTQTDQGFTGTLQLNPTKPRSQQHVTLTFTINDQFHKFQINKCDCEVTIAVPGKLPYTQKITTPAAATGGLYSVMVPFVFPRGGSYEISFAGHPTTPNAFNQFNLTWHLQIDSTANEIQTLRTPKQSAQSNIVPITIAVLLFVTVAGLFVFKKIFQKS